MAEATKNSGMESGMPGLLAAPLPEGMIRPGNIDLTRRPIVKNKDGSISTVRSINVGIDGVEYLIHTVSDDGRIMSDDQAVSSFLKTGRHLGAFATPALAAQYAKRLHEDQAKLYLPQAGLLGR